MYYAAHFEVISLCRKAVLASGIALEILDSQKDKEQNAFSSFLLPSPKIGLEYI